MQTATPSPLVRQKLATVSRRIAWAHWLRGGTILVATLVPLQMAFFGLSFWPGLHTLELRLALSAFLAVAVGLIAMCIYRRFRVRLGARTLAALFERQYPELGEKLLSTVELSQSSSPHGAVPFIAMLAQATDRQADSLDPRQVYRLDRVMRGVVGASVLLIGALALFAVSPRYARFCGRLFAAWTHPYDGYRIQVLPGDAWVARGRSATIAARIEPLESDETLPSDCFLMYEEDGGKPQRMKMDPADSDTFLFSWPSLRHDVTYRIESGHVATESFRLFAVDPIELAAAPIVQVMPPPYVNDDLVPARTLTGGGSFAAVQYGQARFQFAFTTAPMRATLKLRDASSGEALGELIAVPDESGLSARVDLVLDRCGTFAATLHIEGEHNIVTAVPMPAWTVRPDAAPQFTMPLHIRGVRDAILYGKELVIGLDELLRVQAVIEDTEGVAQVALEYRINDGPVVVLPWTDGKGSPRISIDHALVLPAGFKEGDRYRFRLRGQDNRELAKGAIGPNVPEKALTPQTTYSPGPVAGEERWVELKVGKSTDSLRKHEIAIQHEELSKLIDQVRQKLRKEHAILSQLRQASHHKAEVSPMQAQQLAEAGQLNQGAASDLEQIATKLEAVPELAALAEHFRAISDNELVDAAVAMEQFKTAGRRVADREKDVQSAEAAVLEALRKLDGLANLEARLAQERLDQLEMERLAQQERNLARQVEDLLAQFDPADEKAAKEMASLRARQDEIAERLRQLAQKSDQLRQEMDKTQPDMAKQLADKAGQLVDDQRELMKPGGDGPGSDLSRQLDELAKKQADLAGRIHKLAAKPEGLSLPPFTEADQAADALRQGALEQAWKRQGKTESDLHDWVDQLKQDAGPTGSWIKELAKRQGIIRSELDKLGGDYANGRIGDKDLGKGLADLFGRQKALAAEIAKLGPVKGAAGADKVLAAARKAVEEAAELLGKKDTLSAIEKMEEARRHLEQLAQLVPGTAPDPPMPPDPAKTDTAKEKAKVQQRAQAEELAAEQKKLREETQRLAAEMAKSPGAGADKGKGEKLLAQMKQLADDTLKLAQQPVNPEAMKMAKESADFAQQALQAMQKSMAEKMPGKSGPTQAMDKETLQKLELTKEKLGELAGKMPRPGDKMAQALSQGKDHMKAALQKLQSQPAQAPKAMQQAAAALDQAAQMMNPSLPAPPSRPGSGPGKGLGKAPPPLLAKQLEAFKGRSWGELPGELKTQLLQDARAYFGDDYAPIIQQYFEQIAGSEPTGKRPGSGK